LYNWIIGLSTCIISLESKLAEVQRSTLSPTTNRKSFFSGVSPDESGFGSSTRSKIVVTSKSRGPQMSKPRSSNENPCETFRKALEKIAETHPTAAGGP
jgi:hypothetical protein